MSGPFATSRSSHGQVAFGARDLGQRRVGVAREFNEPRIVLPRLVTLASRLNAAGL
ncbi:hypothetical protein [Caenimonas sp. SL110]|uniref:hypothetical protein n=1 Tax=Caenimonas sp. SL110 TaxID=1450524 RepID=UPI001379151E|nr:hypothetical protein [Caenimonas sp. SL110]